MATAEEWQAYLDQIDAVNLQLTSLPGNDYWKVRPFLENEREYAVKELEKLGATAKSSGAGRPPEIPGFASTIEGFSIDAEGRPTIRGSYVSEAELERLAREQAGKQAEVIAGQYSIPSAKPEEGKITTGLTTRDFLAGSDPFRTYDAEGRPVMNLPNGASLRVDPMDAFRVRQLAGIQSGKLPIDAPLQPSFVNDPFGGMVGYRRNEFEGMVEPLNVTASNAISQASEKFGTDLSKSEFLDDADIAKAKEDIEFIISRANKGDPQRYLRDIAQQARNLYKRGIIEESELRKYLDVLVDEKGLVVPSSPNALN